MPPEPTVAPVWTPRTVSRPPLSNVVLFADPPASTVRLPPDPTLVPLARPLVATVRAPPDNDAPVATPPMRLSPTRRSL